MCRRQNGRLASRRRIAGPGSSTRTCPYAGSHGQNTRPTAAILRLDENAHTPLRLSPLKYARSSLQILQPSLLHTTRRPKMVQQRLFPRGADAVEISSSSLCTRVFDRPARCVVYGKPVRLVAEALQIVKHRIARRELKRRPAHRCGTTHGRRRDLDPLQWPPASRPVTPRSSRTAAHRRVLAGTAVDQHHVGQPRSPPPSSCSLQRPSEAALQHLAHHREIVARGDRTAYAVFPVGVFHEAFRDRPRPSRHRRLCP